MRVLVTGATGLLGSAVAVRLAARHEVVAVARPGGTAPADLPGVAWVAYDLATGEGELPGSVDAVVHLAASRRHRDFPSGASDVMALSAGAAVRLLEGGVRRFVLGSSGAVYRPGPAPLDEARDVPQPPGFYGECKLAAERLASWFTPADGVLALRFFFIYGPDQEASMFLPGLAARIRDGRPVILAGEDGFRTNPVFVDDAAAAVVAAVEGEATGVCNVGGPETASVRVLAEHLGALLGVPPRFEHRPPGGDLVPALDRMRALLHDPRIDVRSGIRRAFGKPGP